MNSLTRRTLLRGAVAGACGLVAPAALLRTVAWAQAAESLDEILEPIRAAHGVSALAGAFIRGGDIVVIGAVGVRRPGTTERVQLNARFHIGSCTKSMTATLMAVLVEQGRLSWEATFADVFPDLQTSVGAKYHKVTISQFLAHRSGLPDDRNPDPAIVPQILALAGPLPQQRRRLVELVLSRPPASEPGERMAYSNFGYVVAGAFAEKVTGQDWESLMRQLLFQPLGIDERGIRVAGTGLTLGSHTPLVS